MLSVTVPVTLKVDPLKVRFASPFKLTPLPPVITLLSALFAMVACVGNDVKFAPLPLNDVAVTIPVTSIPCEFAVTAEPTTICDSNEALVDAVTIPVTVKPCGKLGAPLAFSFVI